MRYLSERNFLKRFKRYMLPVISLKYETDGKPDIPARREGFALMLDDYERRGIISAEQAADWVIPESLETKKIIYRGDQA